MALTLPENPNFGLRSIILASNTYIQILAILLGLWPLCLELGYFAWIWAILLGFGLFGRIRVRIGPDGDKDLRMGLGGDRRTDRRTDGQTESPCVLQDFVPFGAAALLLLNLNQTPLKQGTGTADHIPPLG